MEVWNNQSIPFGDDITAHSVSYASNHQKIASRRDGEHAGALGFSQPRPPLNLQIVRPKRIHVIFFSGHTFFNLSRSLGCDVRIEAATGGS